jgi:hypothetical protein
MAIPQWTPNVHNNSPLDINYNGSNGIAAQYSGNPATNGLYSRSAAPNGVNNPNIGGQAGMYQAAAQAGFKSIFGAITKPKAAKLQASQIMANAKLEKAAQEFNAAQLRRYQKQVVESSLKDFMKQIKSAQSFVGTQKAAMSASGSWYGSTFDAFIQDTVQKTEADISARSSEVSEIAANIRFQADMLQLQGDINYKLAKYNAKGIEEQGRVSGLMSLFGLG